MKSHFYGKNLISFDTWTADEVDTVVEFAFHLKEQRRAKKINNLLLQKTLFMIFFEQSTRTRNSLEAAMTQLGGHAHDLTPDKIQITHGESPKDTAQVLSRMGEGIAIRNCFYGKGNAYLTEIEKNANIPLISMQDDVYHPLQAVADLMTIEELFGKNLHGIKVAVCWAYATTHAKPLSVPQSQILLFPRYGMDVAVAHPKEFPLQKDIVRRAESRAREGGGSISFTRDMEEALHDADIVIPKNWGGFAYFEPYKDSERERKHMKENLEKYRHWICDSARFSHAKKDAKIMHALPADRGHEITDELLDSASSVVYEEAENRLHTAKSILALLMGESTEQVK